MTETDQDWRAVADRYWDDLLELEPILGTEVGDERFDDRLPDPTAAGRAHREEVQRRALEEVAAIDRADIDMVGRTTLDLIEAIARRDLASLEHRLDRLASVSHLWGPGTLLADIASLQRADTPERAARYLRRLGAVPAYLDALAEVAADGARVGQTAPGLVVDRSISQVERLIELAPEDAPPMRPVAESTNGTKDRVAALVRDELWPAYGRYLDALRAYRPSARDTIGLSALPGGDAMYASEMLSWTSLALPADHVHELGVEDLERIHEERREIARSLGFDSPAAAIEAYLAGGNGVAKTRDEVVRLAEEQVQRGWDAAPRAFGRRPSSNCEVRPIEAYREADTPFAYYQSPSEDGSRPGVYYVNTGDLDDRPLYHLASTTYHEANPGHHFQVALEAEMGERPSLRRFGGILAGSAFIEGWALYCERLADELGLFLDDYERLGMLEAQGMRAARLVVDTGIHAFDWDRERAIATMTDVGVPRTDAVIEVDRYIAMPGQALAYKLGQFEIQRWRSEAETREGAGFSLSSFHDHLLSLGSLPLASIQRELETAHAG
jgi:uncharacterized protein (DUF885 family)